MAFGWIKKLGRKIAGAVTVCVRLRRSSSEYSVKNDHVTIRENGVTLYSGPKADMTPEHRAKAAAMDHKFEKLKKDIFGGF